MAFDYKEWVRQMRENAVKDQNGNVLCSGELWEEIARVVESKTTADVAEVKHGKWEIIIRNGKPRGIKCSLCGKHIHFHENYCPECGAKMDGG